MRYIKLWGEWTYLEKNREATPSFIPHPSFPLFVNFFLLSIRFITARKRSLRRLWFYSCLSVILFMGGTWAGTSPPPGRYTHWANTTPPGRYPPGQVHPPRQAHPLVRYTPQGRYPSWAGTPPILLIHCFIHPIILSQTRTKCFSISWRFPENLARQRVCPPPLPTPKP